MAETEGVFGSSFFKVFLDKDLTAKSMRIPPAFRKDNLKGKKSAGDFVYLRGRHDPDGTTWKVDLVKDEASSGRGLRFSGRGWLKFLKDHSIGSADFAIFKFDGDDTFKVTIFAPSGCEKHLTPPHINMQEEQEQQVNIPETEAVDDLQAAAAAADDPYFTATLKKHNIKDFLDIPVRFVEEYMKNWGEETRVVLSYGEKEWDVTVVKWKNLKNQRWSFITGWRSFVRQNQLNVGDLCKFQFHQPFRFHVTVSRAN